MQRNNKSFRFIWIPLGMLALIGAFIVLIRRWRIQNLFIRDSEEEVSFSKDVVHENILGLTDEEALSRKQEGLSNEIPTRPRRTINQIIRENTLSIFNLSLVGIALVQLFLGKPLDALLSFGVMLLNIGLNTFQEMVAKRRIRAVELANMPKTTVIREGMILSIDPDKVVMGDVLVVGPGDQIFVDGKVFREYDLVVDESLISRNRDLVKKSEGDIVYAGSFCASGRGVFTAENIGEDRKIISIMQEYQSAKEELTPLEKIIDRTLKIMLVVIALFLFVILLHYFRVGLIIPVDVFLDAVHLIFSIAPAGLFFMILLTYTAGTADLVKFGALVNRARAVETLAQLNVICFSKAGVLTGTHIDIKFLNQFSQEINFSKTRISQILGDFARSFTVRNAATQAIVNSFEGSQRVAIDEAPFLSVYRWCALIFNDPDLRGTFVLGTPDIVAESSIQQEELSIEVESTETSTFRNAIGRFGEIFKRSKPEQQVENGNELKQDEGLRNGVDTNDDQDSIPERSANRNQKTNIFRSIVRRIEKIVPHKEETELVIEEEENISDEDEIILLFSYSPQFQNLFNSSGIATLPKELIPLCELRFSEKVRPEAVQTLEKFANNGVSVKVFTSDPAERTAEILTEAGWHIEDQELVGVVDGAEISLMNSKQILEAAKENQVFGQLSPSQAELIVRSLRDNGQQVGVLGDGINDVPALRNANLPIAMQSSDQVARSVADIILLENSADILQGVLDKGQRIVNGLMDVLKLYLTQIVYLTILIIAIQIVAYGYPYQSAQGGIISFLTLTLPSIGLSLWASSGILLSNKLGYKLIKFFAPSAVTIAVASTFVYWYFLNKYEKVPEAQLAVTYTLVGVGLLLVLMLKPPFRILVGGARIKGDQRFSWLVIFGLVMFSLLVSIPISQELFKLDLLQTPSDYLIILVVVILWAITLGLIWRIWLKFGE